MNAIPTPQLHARVAAPFSGPSLRFLILVGIFAVLPWILPAVGMNAALGTEILIYSLFALAFNLVLGNTGLPSFGHAAFFGTGAYAVAILQERGIRSLPLQMLGAIAAGAIAAGLVGFLVRRKRGIYFGLLTLAFGQMFYIVAMRWDEVTGGETGLTGVVRPPLSLGRWAVNLAPPIAFHYFVLAVFAICVAVLWRIVNSPFGAVLTAIKGNELRVQYSGYATANYKWAVFALSGAFSGVAGGLFALLQFAAYPQYVFWVESGNVVIVTLIGGGLTSFAGPILGSAIFVGAQELISKQTEHWMLFFGLIFVAVVMGFPDGIPGAFNHLAGRWRQHRSAPDERATSS